jgi:hypothetical protein
VPTPAPPSCPAGYDLHTHGSIAFSACCPTGWAISDYEDAAQGIRGVLFQAPGSDRNSGAGLRTISVRVAPNTTGVSGDDFLNAAALALFRKYGNPLLDHIDTLQVDGRVGVEAAYQRELPFATGTVQVTGWEAVFLVDNQQWTIEVVGRSEYRAELEGIHNEFLSHFTLTH